jgi:hypothetical protein
VRNGFSPLSYSEHREIWLAREKGWYRICFAFDRPVNSTWQHGFDAVATELGVAAGSIDQMY